MAKVAVIGAGPAGIMAAIKAAENHDVILLDRNDKIGKKLYITGKGRCNITNSKDISEFFDYIPGNPHFLYSALYTYDNKMVIDFFEELGVKLKSERGGRVFPCSDKSSDIISALKKELNKKKVKVLLNSKVVNIIKDKNKVYSIQLENGKSLDIDHLIVCTGGKSYPKTGSDGFCYSLLENLGHEIVPLKPSLVPIEVENEYADIVVGVTLKNISFSILDKVGNKEKVIYQKQGELNFTYYGVSGPVVLSGSRYINTNKNLYINIDLKPALNEKDLDLRLQKDFNLNLNSEFKDSLNKLFPQRLIPLIIQLSEIDKEKKVHSITKEERKKLVGIIKNLRFKVKKLRGISEAIVTAGGVSTKEIDPSTMKSKLIDNLSFAGEVIDVDALTGGYNIQIALSTGYLAGENI